MLIDFETDGVTDDGALIVAIGTGAGRTGAGVGTDALAGGGTFSTTEGARRGAGRTEADMVGKAPWLVARHSL